MSDVRIFQTPDGGEVLVEIGTMAVDDGLESTVFLSLFGGNEDDAGGDDIARSWWANALETDPARQYRSQTQNLLRSIPATSFNMRRIKAAAVNDLTWMVDAGIFKAFEVSVYIPRPNWVRMIIETELGSFEFTIPWEAIG